MPRTPSIPLGRLKKRGVRLTKRARNEGGEKLIRIATAKRTASAVEADAPTRRAVTSRWRGETGGEAQAAALDAQRLRLLDRGRDIQDRHGELTQVVAMLARNPNIDLSLVSDETGILGHVVPAPTPNQPVGIVWRSSTMSLTSRATSRARGVLRSIVGIGFAAPAA